jgi:hypothetical protein
MWKSTLSMYLPHAEMLPDLYGDSLDLPSRDEHFGERALRDLAARSDYDQLSAWSAVVDQLLSELSRESVGEFATTS